MLSLRWNYRLKSGSLLAVLFLLANTILPADTISRDFTPAHLASVWWDLGKQSFRSLEIDFTIARDLPVKPGIYIQFYQGMIGDVSFYFGLQTDIYKPGRGWKGRWKGKGILYSRWDTRDLANARPAAGGWTQSAGYEGDFIGVRRKYAWTTHRYRFRLAEVDKDSEGVWYALYLLDFDTNEEVFAGALRFPGNSEIRNGGGTWVEVYSHAKSPADVPAGHVIISGVFADGRSCTVKHAVSEYYRVQNADVFYEPDRKLIHLLFGRGVHRRHWSGRLF